jgi:TolB-like protein/lipoprotein NlpI
MLGGRRPFVAETGFALSAAILNEPPPPLPDEPPAAVRAVVERCLAKASDERFQTADEARAALETARTGGVITLHAARATVGQRRLWWLAGAALAAIVAVLAVLDVGGVRRLVLGRAGRPQAVRMAVLPFVNLTGDPEQEYLSDGITQEMISELGRLHPESLSVIARSSVMRYKGGDRPVDQIGRELGVQYVLEGSARREADRVRITAELIQVQDQTQLWANSYEREVAGVLSVQSEVARDIAHRINLALTPEQETRLTSARPVNPEVYEAYTRGMYYVSQNTRESFDRGIDLLHQAVAIDPAEPLAYIGLAEGYITLGHGGGERADAFQRARAAAEQALKLEPDRAEAIGILADVALYYEWDWAKAEELFKRALQLNPSLAMTHYHYAWYLAGFDRLDEAIAEHKLARDLDPLRALNTGWLGHLYNYAGRYDEAIVEANKALELSPTFGPSFLVLRFAYSGKGMHREAIATAQRAAEIDPSRGKVQLVTAYALAGQKKQALEILATVDRPALPSPTQMAIMYLALGDSDAALRELEAGYETHRATTWGMRIHGNGLDALRDEPRFQDLLRKMNLPP